MKVLVTGGAGFIGSHIVDALAERGDDVAVIDDLSGGSRGNLHERARLHEVDIRDRDAVQRTFEEERPELVFHLAAQVDVRKSLEDPANDARTNVEGTVNVLEAARTTGARRLVNTSTGGAIYGEGDHIPVPTPETAAAEPMAAYGQSKYCAERYCRWAHRLHGFEAVTLRYGNVYGPRQNPHADAGVIAIFAGRALRGERPLVFGDGKQTRDYVYVTDVVRANLLAAEHREATHGEFNVGTEAQSTILDVIDAFSPLLDDPAAFADPEFRPARLGELQRSALDITKARDTLGYRAQVPLAEGVQRTFEALKRAS